MTTVLVSAAVSAAVALLVVLLAQRLSDRSERQRLRRDVLRKIAGHRYLITGDVNPAPNEFWVALNEIVIAYLDDEEVMDELRTFRERVDCGQIAEDFVPLMKAMARAARLPSERLDSEMLTYSFAPRTTSGRQIEPGRPDGSLDQTA